MKKDQLLNYLGYYGSISIDPENNILYGKVEFVRAIITYEAKDAGGLMKAFHEAVDDYLNFCKLKKIKPEQPFKGSLNIRIGEVRHRKAWLAAKSLEKSLNDYICYAIDESFERNENDKENRSTEGKFITAQTQKPAVKSKKVLLSEKKPRSGNI